MLTPAPCAVSPLWNTTEPAGAGQETGSIFFHSGYNLKSPAKFSPMLRFSLVAVRWLPGMYAMQPFFIVASSSATHMVIACFEKKDQNGLSRCHAVGLPRAGL